MDDGNITKLEALSNEEAKNYYDYLMKNIQKPIHAEFVEGKVGIQLEIVLMETRPSESKYLIPAIYNIGNVYGDKGVAFTVVHNAVHSTVLNEAKKDYKGMRLIELTQEHFSISDYNILLSSIEFWNNFQTKFSLITQTDVMIIKPVEEEFYNYDFIGAPWPHRACPNKAEQVGNGGYSLRNNTKMREVLGWAQNVGPEPEDVWWCARVPNTPTVEFARRFSVELHDIKDIPPTGSHQMDRMRGAFNSGGDFFRYFKKVNKISGC